MILALALSGSVTALPPSSEIALRENHPKAAVLVLDLQKDFLADDGKMVVERRQIPGMLAATNAVIEQARTQNHVVVYIGNEFSPGDWLMNLFRRGAAVKGTPGTAMDPRVTIVSPYYFPKQQGNAFTNPALEPFLRGKGITELVVTGVYSDGCVKETTEGALRLGFPVTVLSDAVASSTSRRNEQALRDMSQAGAQVLSSQEWQTNSRR